MCIFIGGSVFNVNGTVFADETKGEQAVNYFQVPKVKSEITYTDEDFIYEQTELQLLINGWGEILDYYLKGLSAETIENFTLPHGTVLKGFSASGKEKLLENGGVLNIPSMVAGQEVVAIDNSAFKEIELPKSLKLISDYAFEYNTNLETILLFEGLYILGEYPFYKCSKLDNSSTKFENMLTVPSSIVGTIWDNTFSNTSYNFYEFEEGVKILEC
ncbi:MAG: leucine-rich repeat protein [Bacilli bacterium]